MLEVISILVFIQFSLLKRCSLLHSLFSFFDLFPEIEIKLNVSYRKLQSFDQIIRPKPSRFLAIWQDRKSLTPHKDENRKKRAKRLGREEGKKMAAFLVFWLLFPLEVYFVIGKLQFVLRWINPRYMDFLSPFLILLFESISIKTL